MTNLLRQFGTIGVIAGLVLLLDLFTKHLAFTVWNETPLVFTPWAQFTYSENVGIAFGLPFGGWPLLVVSSLLIGGFVGAAIWMLDLKHCFVRIAVGLVLGGAIGNFLDRALLSYVRDFIQIGPWPTFNVADSSIVIGLLLLLIFYPYSPSHERH